MKKLCLFTIAIIACMQVAAQLKPEYMQQQSTQQRQAAQQQSNRELSHIEKFVKAFRSNDMAKSEQILKEWNQADSNDPELYVAYFNFFTVKSLEKDSVKPDMQYARKALEYIGEGIRRFPTRFDMRVVEIVMHSRIKEFEPFTKKVIDLIEFSKKINCQWKGEAFRLIEYPDEVFSGAVHDFQGTLFAANDTALFKNIVRISEVMHKNFPNNHECLLNLSTVYYERKQYDKSIETLLQADKVKPNNSILQYNLAWIYAKKGDRDNARRYYELTVRNATDQEAKLKEAAQKQLDELKK
ncbi:MAG: tetratricopeptide repeat protein [Tannerella sp.]|nr:tetratricopeptide repeat protein [Tannerella sp.]